MPVAKITDKHMQMLKEIAHATGADPEDPKAVASAFHSAVSTHHARIVQGKDAGGADERPLRNHPEALGKISERMGADVPGAEKKALERLGPEVDPDTEEPPASSSASASGDDADGASTSDAPVHSPLKRWARPTQRR